MQASVAAGGAATEEQILKVLRALKPEKKEKERQQAARVALQNAGLALKEKRLTKMMRKVRNTHLLWSAVDPTLLSTLPCYGPLTAR